MITLYGQARVPFTEKVRRALLYKGLDFELVEPTSVEDYKRFSPKTGMLPALDLHGEHVPDSTEILLRLDQVYPEPPLLSPDPTVAVQQRQLEEWADESFLWYFMKYRRQAMGDDYEAPLPLAGEPAAVPPSPKGSSLLRRLGAWLRAGGTWERPHTALLRELALRLDDLANFLGARPFFYAERLSMADLAVYSMLVTLREDRIPGSALLLAARPTLIALLERVERVTGGGPPYESG
ncbi:MAG TPA: glutathione S-transferase family protein [Myxococcota bacterium]|nr:glutathione S-transferase family protein [Myxococcota bacterium]